MRLNGFSWCFYWRISLNIETNHVLLCVSGCWSAIQEVSGLPMDPHSHMAHWYCQYSVFLWFHTSNICCPINSQRSVSISLIKDGVEYPLTQSGPYGRWFHSEFCDFISVLVGQCQHSVLFDSYLMNSLMSLLTELSNSPIRAFRHTCTLAGKSLNMCWSLTAFMKLMGIFDSRDQRWSLWVLLLASIWACMSASRTVRSCTTCRGQRQRDRKAHCSLRRYSGRSPR